MPRRKLFDVSLVVVRRHQFVLAAREECHKIFQEFGRLGQPPEKHQSELRDVAPQQDLVIDVFERLNIRIRRAQNFFEAEFMKRAQPYAFGALADRFHHAVLHLARGFVCKREPQNIFAGKLGIRFQQTCECAR